MSAEPAPSLPAPVKLGSRVFPWDTLVAKPTPLGVYRAVVDAPTATFERFECHVTTLNPGEKSHPPHHHPQEEFIVLREGTLDVFINGRVQRAGAGSLLFFAANDVHNVTNVGDTPATYVVFNVVTAATHRVPAQPAAETAAPGRLHSSVFDWRQIPVEATKSGERRAIVDAPTVTFTNFEAHATTLRAGQIAHGAHHHPDEEIILVKEGTIEATFGGKTERGGPGSIFFYGSNDVHGMRNAGDGTATYYVIRIVTPVSAVPDHA
ncbi:MAG TPA: cupin domain-containing protein [Opitutaceae bacterium]|nr:cupin domain-containing protein [Opitutaceae bacterium]